MERMKSIFGGRIWAFILSGTLIGLLFFAIAMIWRGARAETIVLQVQPISDPNVVRIYVGGEVNEPGLYTLPRGSRVAEALEAAGGPTAAGDLSRLGMATVVEDADQIIVPTAHPTSTPVAIRPVSGASGVLTDTPTSAASGLININTASESELDALPGVGPARAAAIVEWRETHGPFRSIDDLEEISGISERMVNEWRHLVTVGP